MSVSNAQPGAHHVQLIMLVTALDVFKVIFQLLITLKYLLSTHVTPALLIAQHALITQLALLVLMGIKSQLMALDAFYNALQAALLANKIYQTIV